MQINQLLSPLSLSFLLASGLFGCSATPHNTIESHGLSVKNMIAQQTAEPWEEGEGLDGEKSVTVLDSYRGDVGDPKSVEGDLDFDVGG